MKLLVQRDKEFRSALYDIMGFYPHNVELYRIAFAHKSQEYKSKKTGDRPLNNERLEFLGDAVLETVVSDIVYHHFKNKREGFLTNTRSKIVSRESLGKLAKDLGIDRLIQSHTNSKAHNSFLAGNAFEALMGAIYLDRGFDYAFRFIEHRIMGSVLDLEGVAHKEVNFKSKLLEWSQKNRIRIDFKDKQIDASSSNTPSFATTIILEGLFAGDGKGFSKKEAHQNASKDALTRMRREPKFIDDVFSSKEKRTAMEADPCFVLPVIDEIEAEIARENENKSRRKEQPKKEQSAKSEANKEQSKKEQPAKKEKPKKEQPTKEQPKEQAAKPDPKKEQPKEQAPKEKAKEQAAKSNPKKEQLNEQPTKSEPKKEQPKEQAAKSEPLTPIVIPIAFEDILDDAPAGSETPAANNAEELKNAPSEQKKASAEQPEAVAEQPEAQVRQSEAVSEQTESVAEQADATTSDAVSSPAEPAVAKKPRRRGRRQNAAGFTNTDIIPAETSHRADKAAKKVEEAKKEKARKLAKKSARKAAKGIENDNGFATDVENAGKNNTENNVVESKTAESNAAEKSAADTPKGALNRKKQPKANTEKPADNNAASQEKPAVKKPRRRRKTKAELPSETPNPEREQAIAAAENAAYQQPNEE